MLDPKYPGRVTPQPASAYTVHCTAVVALTQVEHFLTSDLPLAVQVNDENNKLFTDELENVGEAATVLKMELERLVTVTHPTNWLTGDQSEVWSTN